MSVNDEMSSRTKQLLLDAAVKLFSTNGYAETSLQQLVDEAGLTKGAFYHHYRSKEEILRQIHDAFIDEQLARATAAVEAASTPSQALRSLIRSEMQALHQHQDVVTVFLRERRAFSPGTWQVIRRKRDRLENVVVGLMKEGMAAGEFRDGDPRLIAYGVLGMIHWAHEWFRPGKFGPTERVADTFADMVLDGLRTGR